MTWSSLRHNLEPERAVRVADDEVRPASVFDSGCDSPLPVHQLGRGGHELAFGAFLRNASQYDGLVR